MLSLHEYTEQQAREAEYESRQDRIERHGHPVELDCVPDVPVKMEQLAGEVLSTYTNQGYVKIGGKPERLNAMARRALKESEATHE